MGAEQKKTGLARSERTIVFSFLLSVVVFSLETQNTAFTYVAMAMGFLAPVFAWIFFNRPSSRKLEYFAASLFSIALPVATLWHRSIGFLGGTTVKELVGMAAAAMLIFELAYLIFSISEWEAAALAKTQKPGQTKSSVQEFELKNVGGLA